MRNEEKLRVVESGDVLEINRTNRKSATTPITPLNARPPYDTPYRASGYTTPAPPASTMHYALLMTLTWLSGPAALLLTRSGRRQQGWVVLSVSSTVAGLIVLMVPYARMVALTGLATPLAWGALAMLASLGGFTAWARATQLIAASVPPQHRAPRLLRSPLVIFALGLMAPGSGLLASGSRWRAALWLWALWPAALGAVVLRSGLGMWRHLVATVPNAAAADLLETSILLAVGAVTAGAIVWLVQALEGARRVAPPSSSSRGRADWFAVALGLSCATLAIAGQPGRAARELGDAALVLRAEGMSIIPLQLSLAADRLDPSCAEYAVQAIALHEERGERDRADRLRARLDEGLASYMALLGADRTVPAGGDSRAPTIRPRIDDPARSGDADLYYGALTKPQR